jgi:hypothetical protein
MTEPHGTTTVTHTYDDFDVAGKCIHGNDFELHQISEMLDTRLIAQVVLSMHYDYWIDTAVADDDTSDKSDRDTAEMNFRYILASTPSNHSWESLKHSTLRLGRDNIAKFVASGLDIQRVWLNFTLFSRRQFVRVHGITATVKSSARVEMVNPEEPRRQTPGTDGTLLPGEFGKPIDVFISYSADDREIAEDLANRLRALQLSVFLAHDTITTGPTWRSQVGVALRRCTVAVLLLSSKSLGSDWVRYEIGAIWALNKPCAPALLNCEAAELPELVREFQARSVTTAGDRSVFCYEVERLVRNVRTT